MSDSRYIRGITLLYLFVYVDRSEDHIILPPENVQGEAQHDRLGNEGLLCAKPHAQLWREGGGVPREDKALPSQRFQCHVVRQGAGPCHTELEAVTSGTRGSEGPTDGTAPVRTPEEDRWGGLPSAHPDVFAFDRMSKKIKKQGLKKRDS